MPSTKATGQKPKKVKEKTKQDKKKAKGKAPEKIVINKEQGKNEDEDNGDSDYEDNAQDKQRMLDLLQSHCADMLGFEAPEKEKEAEKHTEYEKELESLQDLISEDDEDYDSENSDDSGEDFDSDAEDLLLSDQETTANTNKEAKTINPKERKAVVYYDPSANIQNSDNWNEDAKREVKNFMASSINKQKASVEKPKKKKKSSKDDEEDEQHMKELDNTLSNVLKSLPTKLENTSATKVPGMIDKNTPLPIRKAKEAYRVKKAKELDQERRQGHIITAKNAQEPAVTKRKFRLEQGLESKRRKTASGIGGSVGKVSGGVLRLSDKDIKTLKNGGKPNHQRSGKGGYDGRSKRRR